MTAAPATCDAARADVRSAVLALGANLGGPARLTTLQAALEALAQAADVMVTAVSPVYETVPVGGPEQPDYLNAVALVRTTLDPEALLGRAHAVEAALGRQRHERWGPRTIDIDLVAVGAEVRADRELTLPHPRAHVRAFVLQPWADVDPAAVIPGHGPVRDLLAALPEAAVPRRRADLSLRLPS